MNNPCLKAVLVAFPDVDAASLPWPEGADTWEQKDVELFIGSGGFLKPKKKKADAKPQAPAAKPQVTAPSTKPEVTATQHPPPAEAAGTEDMPSGFEVPGFSRERCAITMPVRVHCEDTTPYGHVRLESLTAFAERIRSVALKQIMGVSLADLKEMKLAILATEYVIEITGQSFRVLDSLRIDTNPEFPAAPLFPWETTMHSEDGQLYAQGRFGLNLCRISDTGTYSGIEEAGYREFTDQLRKWVNPSRCVFSPTALRFFNAYTAAGKPFKPTSYREEVYVVRASDCDMYNVLFQARVPSFLESCSQRYNPSAMYVNIRTSVRPGDSLAVHLFSEDDAVLFLCLRGKECVLSAFGIYGAKRPMFQEAVKCASVRIPPLLKFCQQQGQRPTPNEDCDLSLLP